MKITAPSQFDWDWPLQNVPALQNTTPRETGAKESADAGDDRSPLATNSTDKINKPHRALALCLLTDHLAPSLSRGRGTLMREANYHRESGRFEKSGVGLRTKPVGP